MADEPSRSAGKSAKPVPDWIQAHGIVDRPTGLKRARASRQLVTAATTNALGRDSSFGPAPLLLGGLINRGIGLHEGAIAALETDNPFSAFTLIRSLAENAASLLYAVEHPTKIERILGLDGSRAMAIGKITSYANRSERFGAFQLVYSQLSEYAHPLSKSITASASMDDEKFRWWGTPAFRPGNDFLMACVWLIELAGANADLIVDFANVQGW
ncbi:hypothetical protein [Mycolicibacterium peregrinum]|uniref:hypothetical protein n=1 Tax=Mycolicibacterium peregrinum TaxID=43304 RepID=UPI000B28C0E1|nr:hypothetical protein [Mycolicibacterium peregrinum]